MTPSRASTSGAASAAHSAIATNDCAPASTATDVLIIDDFALRPLDATETSDFYEIIVERHRTKTTIVTSNREPANG